MSNNNQAMPKVMTTRQLMGALAEDVKRMSPQEKAEFRQQLDEAFRNRKVNHRPVYIEIPMRGSFHGLAQALHGGYENLSPADREQWDANCKQWREERALLAMPLPNDWVN